MPKYTPRENAFRSIVACFIAAYKVHLKNVEFVVACEGEDLHDGKLTKMSEIFDHLRSVDHAHLYAYDPASANDDHISFVYFIWGNEVHECISDYSLSLDKTNMMHRAQSVADSYDLS